MVVSAGVDGPCVRIRLQRDPAALADRDPLVDLIEVFDRTASELGTRLELRAQDDGSLVCMTVLSTEPAMLDPAGH